MARLHIYKDEKIPELIRQNITDQIRPERVVPRRLDSYTKEEQDAFPKVFDYPKDYVLPTIPPFPEKKREGKPE
jgi:large subunit ribosomal protein L13